jgi:hypothetical protein
MIEMELRFLAANIKVHKENFVTITFFKQCMDNASQCQKLQTWAPISRRKPL